MAEWRPRRSQQMGWLTSDLGQTEKKSVGANCFRGTLKSGHRSIQSACLKSAQKRPLNRFEARARQAALVTIHVIQHAAAVLSVTSTRAEGEARALLQTLSQRQTHQRARRPGAALALHVAHEAESALGDHLAGRVVARITVARDYRLDPSATRHLAQEEDVVETLLALFPSRACAGFETAGPDQGNHRGERLRRHASDFPKTRRDHHLVVDEVRAVGMT